MYLLLHSNDSMRVPGPDNGKHGTAATAVELLVLAAQANKSTGVGLVKRTSVTTTTFLGASQPRVWAS